MLKTDAMYPVHRTRPSFNEGQQRSARSKAESVADDEQLLAQKPNAASTPRAPLVNDKLSRSIDYGTDRIGSLEFSRGGTKSSAKLFDPRKDNPLTHQTALRNVVGQRDKKPRPRPAGTHKQVSHPKGDRRISQMKPHDRPDPQSGPWVEINSSEAYQKRKNTVIVTNEAKPQNLESTARVVILQNPATVTPEDSELVRELKGPKYDDKSRLEEARRLHAAAKVAETAAQEAVVRTTSSPDSGDEMFNAHVLRTIAHHRALLDIYYDFLVITQHPAAPDAVKKLPQSYNVLERLWSIALRPSITHLKTLFNEHVSETKMTNDLSEIATSFLYYAYAVLASLAVCVPSMKVEWYESLGLLASEIRNMPKQSTNAMTIPVSDWGETAIKWYKKAIRYQPGIGKFYVQLYHLYPTADLLTQLYLREKARFVQFPMTEDSLDDAYEYPALDAAYTNYSSNTFGIARNLTIYMTALRDISAKSDWENLRAEVLASDPLWERTAQIAFLNICTVDRKFRITETSLIEEGFKEIRLSGDAGLVEDYATNLVDLAIELLEHACYSEHPDALSHMFVWLVYLLYTADQPAWTKIEKLIPWASLAFAITKQTKSVLFTADTFELQQLPVISHENLPGVLPEDSVLRGSVFALPVWPESCLREVEIDDEDETLLMSSSTQLHAVHSERILWLGRRLAQRCENLAYDPCSHQFSSLEDPLGQVDSHSKAHQSRVASSYTIVVCDTTVLLRKLEVLDAAHASGITLVLPLVTLKELDKLRQDAYEHSPDLSPVVASVITKIEHLVKARKIRVVAADGSSLHDLSFRRETDTDRIGSYREQLIQALEHQARQHPVEHGSTKRIADADLVVLLSASHENRMAAFDNGIFALSPAHFKSMLAR